MPEGAQRRELPTLFRINVLVMFTISANPKIWLGRNVFQFTCIYYFLAYCWYGCIIGVLDVVAVHVDNDDCCWWLWWLCFLLLFILLALPSLLLSYFSAVVIVVLVMHMCIFCRSNFLVSLFHQTNGCNIEVVSYTFELKYRGNHEK